MEVVTVAFIKQQPVFFNSLMMVVTVFVILFKMFLVECLFFGLLVSGFIFSAITYQEM